jgi:TonB family protein
MSCSRFMRCLIVALGLLAAGTSAASEIPDACDAAAWRSRVAAAEKAVVSSAPYKIPAGLWRRSTKQVCAVVAFTVDADGRAASPEVLASTPNAGAGRGALETLEGYRFSAPRGTRLVLRFQLSRFGLVGE